MDFIFFLVIVSVPYGNSPSWESNSGDYSTGGGFCDINLDSYPDFVVSNGNDMQTEQNVIYFNSSGSLSTFPNWFSADFSYSGHLAIIDFNRDGFFDFAVSNYIGPAGFSEPGNVMVYKNNNGTVGNSPFWVSKDSTYTFSSDFGDIDGDGYPELAIAGGERYYSNQERIKIYKNNGISFDSLPFWMSQNYYFAYDVLFYDIDKDNWLDLIVACDGEPNLIFHNNSGVLDIVPFWQSLDSDGSLQVDAGDIDGNGYPDLIFANNGQLPPYKSSLKIYYNFTGIPEPSASITLDTSKEYYSTVSLCDVDYDGDLDIGAGGWWEPLVVFENTGAGSFNFTPDWAWSPSNPSQLVCEKVSFTDIDIASSDTLTDTFAISQKVPAFTLSKRPVMEIVYVAQRVNGIPLPVPETSYVYHKESGILMVDTSILSNNITGLSVKYKFPIFPDISVTNWAPDRGNFIFVNTNTGIQEATQKNSLFKTYSFKNSIILLSHEKGNVELCFYDVQGRKIFSKRFSISKGKNIFPVYEVKAGIYFSLIEFKGKLYKNKIFILP